MSPDTRVNCVAPGFVPTHFADFLTRDETIVSILSVRFFLHFLSLEVITLYVVLSTYLQMFKQMHR